MTTLEVMINPVVLSQLVPLGIFVFSLFFCNHQIALLEPGTRDYRIFCGLVMVCLVGFILGLVFLVEAVLVVIN